mgnify:CR=1 FL=1
MSWSPAQRQRILDERDILNVYFPDKVTWLHGQTKVDIKMTTNNNNEYCLRVYLPEDFPNSVPDLVVTHSPKPMPNWENYGQTHRLKRRENNLYDIFM